MVVLFIFFDVSTFSLASPFKTNSSTTVLGKTKEATPVAGELKSFVYKTCLLTSVQVFKYGIVYICIMAIFVALIALRESLRSSFVRISY